MAFELKVGQTIPFSIRYLDQSGVEMLTEPRPDSPPSWANLHPEALKLTAASDGVTASGLGVAEGADTIQLSLSVGGQTFTATIDGTVLAGRPAQTLGSVQIVAGTPI